jgi:hypothetical protein
MNPWTLESALAELNELVETLIPLQKDGYPTSADHIRWHIRTVGFLKEVFGVQSPIYRRFAGIRWRYSGSMAVMWTDLHNPMAAQMRHDMPVYLEALEIAGGILMGAMDDLNRKGIEGVYEGKDTGPEASLLLQIMNLAELKLRKVIRAKPQKEREIQDAFENLVIANDIPHSREKETIEYSSKAYIPDFTVQKADLAIDIKLATADEHEKALIPQINDDILAYRTKYGNLLFVVYDCGIIRDVDRFIGSFEANGPVSVRVVKH